MKLDLKLLQVRKLRPINHEENSINTISSYLSVLISSLLGKKISVKITRFLTVCKNHIFPIFFLLLHTFVIIRVLLTAYMWKKERKYFNRRQREKPESFHKEASFWYSWLSRWKRCRWRKIMLVRTKKNNSS